MPNDVHKVDLLLSKERHFVLHSMHRMKRTDQMGSLRRTVAVAVDGGGPDRACPDTGHAAVKSVVIIVTGRSCGSPSRTLVHNAGPGSGVTTLPLSQLIQEQLPPPLVNVLVVVVIVWVRAGVARGSGRVGAVFQSGSVVDIRRLLQLPPQQQITPFLLLLGELAVLATAGRARTVRLGTELGGAVGAVFVRQVRSHVRSEKSGHICSDYLVSFTVTKGLK